MAEIRCVDEYYFNKYPDRTVILTSGKDGPGTLVFIMDDDSFDFIDNSVSTSPFADIVSDTSNMVKDTYRSVEDTGAGQFIKKIPYLGGLASLAGGVGGVVSSLKKGAETVTGSKKINKYMTIKKVTDTDGLNKFTFNFTITKDLDKVISLFNKMTLSKSENGFLTSPYLDINTMMKAAGESAFTSITDPSKFGENIEKAFAGKLCTVKIGDWLLIDKLIPESAGVTIRTDAFSENGMPILGTGRISFTTLYDTALDDAERWTKLLKNTNYTFKFEDGE